MPNIVVAGAQWGDEGKGKIVDLLAARVQVVARYNGGHNAGQSGHRRIELAALQSHSSAGDLRWRALHPRLSAALSRQ